MSLRLLPHLLRAPALTGAVAPSSRYLAAAMASAAAGSSSLVELGAGSGPVTKALVERYPETPLVVVELQPELVRTLRARFPAVDVRHAPAAEVLDSLTAAPHDTCVVSSLPFRSLPRDVRITTVQSICKFLARGRARSLVQFTYQPRAPFDVPSHLVWNREKVVLANLPPAAVWVLRVA